jgi:hypothetical protein
VGGSGDEDVFRLDVAVEKVVRVDMLEALHNLEEDALDAGVVEALVVAGLHQLVEVTLHVLHADVQLLAVGVQEDVEGGDEVRMLREGAEKDDLAELQTGRY